MKSGAVLAVLIWASLGTFPAHAEMSLDEEISLGRRAAQQLETRYGLDPSPELNARLQRIAQALVPVSGRKELTYQFKVIQSEEFNAMALPGGWVYATTKVVRDLSDGELAFILGHELSHVSERHSIHQMEDNRLRRLGMLALLIGLGGANMPQQATGLAQIVDQVISSRYSQADEDEADQKGMEMMARAGFDPAYGLLALQSMERERGSRNSAMNAFLGSHPLPRERVEAARENIPAIVFTPPPGQARPALGNSASWERDLLLAVSEGSGWSTDTGLCQQARQELDRMQLDEGGIFMLSPPGETYAQLERRLLIQEVAWRVAGGRGPQRFGLAMRTLNGGEKILWLRVR